MVDNHEVVLHAGGRRFAIPLCRKSERFGATEVDHWWADTRTLYGQRNSSGRVGATLVECFWAHCREQGTAGDLGVRESYLLASLLPRVRSNGSRKVIADARLDAARGTRETDEAASGLEDALRDTRGDRLTEPGFHKETGKALGLPEVSDGVAELYGRFAAGLLGRARGVADADVPGVLDAAGRVWQKEVARWGRRGGAAAAAPKQVLDLISYECRAALHRCYSAAWCELIPALREWHGLDAVSSHFLKFWHLDLVRESKTGPSNRWHVFHGHVPGLHPAGAVLLASPAGRERLGAWLKQPEHQPAYEGVLHAYALATYYYALRRQSVSEERQRRPESAGGTAELEGLLKVPRRRPHRSAGSP